MCSFFIRNLLANTYQNKAEHGPKTFFTIKISLFLHFIVQGTFNGTLMSLSGVPSSVFKHRNNTKEDIVAAEVLAVYDSWQSNFSEALEYVLVFSTMPVWSPSMCPMRTGQHPCLRSILEQ